MLFLYFALRMFLSFSSGPDDVSGLAKMTYPSDQSAEPVQPSDISLPPEAATAPVAGPVSITYDLPPPPPAARHEATLVRDYHGAHQAEFFSQFDRVRLLAQQAPMEVSARLGLIQYRQGFQYPVTILFQDAAPAGIENALAYVELVKSSTGFQQNLVINLDELTAHPMDFDTVFYHEMTHVVMNDAVGGEASAKIPHWAQEGLAIFVSGEGDDRVKQAAKPLYRSQVNTLIYDLNAPVTGNAYPQYYLAIKYILDTYSINAVQALVRDLIAGQPLPDAIQDSMGLSVDEFNRHVQEYSLKMFRNEALQDGMQNPYAIPNFPQSPHGYGK